MSEGIPEGWSVSPLREHTKRVTGRNTTNNKNVLTISAQHGLVNQKEFFNKYVSSQNLSNYFLLKKGEFAYNKSYSKGYPVGVIRQLRRYSEGVLSPLYICFKVDNGQLDADFAEYCFDTYWVEKEIRSIAQQGARAHGLLNVSVGEFFDVELLLPPKPEQHKIASILTSVDEVIEKTEAQISKLQDLKKGMMQALLTKGIGHTEFKDSPVGRIPKGWEVRTIEDALENIIDYRGKSPPKSESGVPLITAKNIREGYIESEPREYIHADQYDSWMVRGMPKYGDILITTEAPLGNVAKVPEYKLAIGQRVLSLSPTPNLIDGNFLLFLMQGDSFGYELLQQSTGSTVAGIKQSTFRKISIPLPPLKEQVQIAKSIESLVIKQTAIGNRLERLKNIKIALMQDLLTGKVRVNVN